MGQEAKRFLDDLALASAPFVGVVKDCGEIIFSTDPLPAFGKKCNDGTREEWRTHNAAKSAKGDEARAWLGKHFPKWDDPFAYWDD